MKTESGVQEYARQCSIVLESCNKCHGRDPDCICRSKYDREIALYEACIPKDFWNISESGITHNRNVFDRVISKYCNKLKTARKSGYGLLLIGDNGVGKSTFISYVLEKAIATGFTAYYTTLPCLDHDLKRGFKDREIADRLQLMLTSDFFAMDEMGKENYHDGDTWIRTQVERILKDRYDNSMPTLIASNSDSNKLQKIYGTTIGSILTGKFEVVVLESGDFRKNTRKRMREEMEYGK